MGRQTLSTWLNGHRWDTHQRSSRYRKDHVIGEGWREDLGDIVEDVVTAQGVNKVTKKNYRFIPGIKRETALASIDTDDLSNNEWPIVFAPRYTDKSWRTRLGRWITPAKPMITAVKANTRKGLLCVTFNNGAEVIYDHVPKEVIFQLRATAKNGGSLGKAFWDLVRYRGHKEGSKYSYWYAKSHAPELQMNQQERDFLDKKIYEVMSMYEEGTDARNLLSADEVNKYIIPLNTAYDDEDYHTMAKLYAAGLKRGLWE